MADLELDYPAYALALSQERHPLDLHLDTVLFDPMDHPRDPLGQFAKVLQDFAGSSALQQLKIAGSGLTVDRTSNGRVRLWGGSDRILANTKDPKAIEKMARRALGQWGRYAVPQAMPTGFHASYDEVVPGKLSPIRVFEKMGGVHHITYPTFDEHDHPRDLRGMFREVFEGIQHQSPEMLAAVGDGRVLQEMEKAAKHYELPVAAKLKAAVAKVNAPGRRPTGIDRDKALAVFNVAEARFRKAVGAPSY